MDDKIEALNAASNKAARACRDGIDRHRPKIFNALKALHGETAPTKTDQAVAAAFPALQVAVRIIDESIPRTVTPEQRSETISTNIGRMVAAMLRGGQFGGNNG
jgi:hypothetical protein